MKKAIGERIGEARSRAGLTKKALAERIGVTPSLVTNYESGDRLPSVEKLIDLAAVLGVSADYLLGLTKSREVEADAEVTAITAEVARLTSRDRRVVTGLIQILREVT